jgi:hypothetical protein
LEEARPWHPPNDAPEKVKIAGARSRLDRASADEEERLVHGMIDEMIKRRD